VRCWEVREPGPVGGSPLVWAERRVPEPAAGELLVAVEACGVCRTDLHVVEGDLPVRRPSVVPGHEVVGRVAARGAGVITPREGDRVGVAWLQRACGSCRFCARGAENLCLAPRFTGWDTDGGYAPLVVAQAEFVYALPEARPAVELAPLLCAGIIGYRAWAQCGVARRGARLGIYGFGGSAHIAIQVARHHGNAVFVVSRGERHQQLARELGADWVGGPGEVPPEPLDAAILFAPAGGIVPDALAALDRGGVLAVAGIHLSEIPPLDYQRHLFQERVLRSVTANTRADGRALLRLAEEIPIRTHVERYPLAGALDALRALAADRVRGAAVLEIAHATG
jgi:propanol-preferring alcohol dehydrogenase